MQITRQADYAVRAVYHLSKLEPGERAATSQIAKAQQIPPSFLAKIVSQLSVAGLLQTSRGARGGVSLARSPEEISLLEVIEAIDGPMMDHLPLAEQTGNAPFSLKMEDVCRKATQEIKAVYQKSTLSAMLGA